MNVRLTTIARLIIFWTVYGHSLMLFWNLKHLKLNNNKLKPNLKPLTHSSYMMYNILVCELHIRSGIIIIIKFGKRQIKKKKKIRKNLQSLIS